MSRTIDIRTAAEENTITTIRFADSNVPTHPQSRQADIIRKDENCVKIFESGNGDYVRIWSISEAENFKKALQKAIDLGWLK